MAKRIVHNVVLGQAGVHRVMAELLSRNVSSGILSGDVAGVDILTGVGARIQVKTTQLKSTDRYPQPHYSFELRACGLVRLHEYRRSNRVFSSQCDFVVLWGMDEDKLWVVPAHILDGHPSVRIANAPRLVFVDVEALKSDRAAGLTYKQMAEKHNVSVQAVWDRLNGNPDPQSGKFSRAVRDCENRWDLIESFGKPAPAEADVSKELDASRSATL